MAALAKWTWYCSDSTGSAPLMLYTFATGAWTVLVDGVKASYPSWSHDGKYVYYFVPSAHSFEIAVPLVRQTSDNATLISALT